MNYTTPCNLIRYNDLFNAPAIVIPNQVKTSGNYIFRNIHFQETRGATPEEYLRPFITKDIFGPANNALNSYERDEVKLIAKNILNLISKELDKHAIVSQLAPIYAFPDDDGSLLIEWIFDNFRIGFSFEKNIADSSWYLVSKISAGNIHAYGDLLDADLNSIVIMLVSFVASQFS